jgi:D-3-phosphoglycerate dehydrogenase
MKKILIATEKPFSAQAVQEMRKIVEDAGNSLEVLEKYPDKATLLDALDGVNALIVRSDNIDKEVLDAAKDLTVVVRAGAGYDNIDLDVASAKDIVVMNTPGQNANAVAELAFGMMLYLIRNGFNGKAGTELRNKKLGIHAYGHVGRIVGLIAKGFGMKTYSFDPFIDKIFIENDGVKYEPSVDGLYSKCQYVSLHLPLNKKTRNSIGYDLLSKMPANAMLINTARKEIINDEGLIKTLEEREDFRFVSDIKPDNAAELLERFPDRVFFTAKKMGAQTAEANMNAGLAAARQIVNYFTKGDKTFQVN